MRETQITFPGRGPGSTHTLTVLTFGTPGARPHVHVQGGLHADEGPGMMAARMLADRLALAEVEGRVTGLRHGPALCQSDGPGAVRAWRSGRAVRSL